MSELGHDRASSVAQISRRGFLGATAAATAALALSGCSPTDSENTLELGETGSLEEGEWVALPCNCGVCCNIGYVVDNMVVRQKTDDTGEDTDENPQNRCCVRGRMSRQRYMGADRLKYPMKRKNWQPGGVDFHGELRGRDEWERISWDEALDLVAGEVKRIMDNHGPKSFFCGVSGDGHGGGAAGGQVTRLLNAMGGCVYVWGTQSYGGIPVVSTFMEGDPWSYGMMETQDVFTACKADTAIIFGLAAGSLANSWYRAMKHAGVRFIVIDPWFSGQTEQVADMWVPVRPGTDGALLLGMAYHMIENNLHDQEFLDAYTVGFDADHMPEDATTNENFKDYVLGAYDETPKTPEWASEICGVSPDKIRELAEIATSASPLIWRSTQAPARTENGQNYTQLFYAVGWMTGNVGFEGAEVAMANPQSVGMGSSMILPGSPGIEIVTNPICEGPAEVSMLDKGGYDPEKFYGLPYGGAWEAIVSGKYTDFVHGEQPIDIRCIWKINSCSPLNQFSGASKGIEAFRKVEFVVTSDLFMTSDCEYSDIVLPAASFWETPWSNAGQVMPLNPRALFFGGKQVIEPLFEAKDDVWMEEELAKRLDIDPKLIRNISWEQASYNVLATTQVMKDDFSGMEPLAAITQEDIDEFGVEGTPQEGRVPIKELLEQGYYAAQRSPDDPYAITPKRADYRNDPVANPRNTPSGKYEIYSQSLTNYMEIYGTTPVVEPLPKYRPADEGYEQTFANWETKEKGEYPFQVISTHSARSVHSSFHNVRQLNEVHANNLMINANDAAALGLEQDETVLVTSKHGKILRRVNITPRIMPGVLMIGEGNWINLNEEGIDEGGSANILAGGHVVGHGHQPWNTCLVKVEKWDGEPLLPDCQRPYRTFDFE
ncbi:molybdopterin-dependent oxidoreductase [Adlercreutzia sp. R7]|uniref:Molybdopterin-dependent oxidoreductase n=1 Tax=Adlercreutzia wanghongyangiae TaxID=3111451 RepID=A0ABU6IK18_9ACTN|nr:molybdopterin-dependent oxidoreductase [Adlercreutzia sp. R7]